MIKSGRMRGAEHVAHMEEKRDAGIILVGKHEGKGSLGRSRHRWEVKIQMDLKEIG
jgi:hypothetical protein